MLYVQEDVCPDVFLYMDQQRLVFVRACHLVNLLNPTITLELCSE